MIDYIFRIAFLIILRFDHIFQTFSSSCTSTVSLICPFSLHLSVPLLTFPYFVYNYYHFGQHGLKTIKLQQILKRGDAPNLYTINCEQKGCGILYGVGHYLCSNSLTIYHSPLPLSIHKKMEIELKDVVASTIILSCSMLHNCALQERGPQRREQTFLC